MTDIGRWRRKPPGIGGTTWRIAALRLMAAFCLGAFAAGCHRDVATPDVCSDILDRIIQIELTEQGFRDPALVTRKQAELSRLLAPSLAACANRRLPRGALACVRLARTTEEISHGCLR
ncbi:MAG: hypothetical protein ABUL77_04645 [Bacteroidota bacterium]